MICFPVTRHVGGCRVSARKAWGHHVATARRRFEREDDVGPRRRIARVARGLLGGAPRRGARRTKSVVPRKTRERRNIWGRRKRGVCAPARPPHRTAWWTKPGAVSGRALSADSVPCAGSGVLAREGSRGLFLRQKSPPPPLAAADETFHNRAHQTAAPSGRVLQTFGSRLNVSAHRGWGTTDRSTAHEAFRIPATRTPSRASREFARGVSRTDPG